MPIAALDARAVRHGHSSVRQFRVRAEAGFRYFAPSARTRVYRRQHLAQLRLPHASAFHLELQIAEMPVALAQLFSSAESFHIYNLYFDFEELACHLRCFEISHFI